MCYREHKSLGLGLRACRYLIEKEKKSDLSENSDY
jgi:hypothetical protein